MTPLLIVPLLAQLAAPRVTLAIDGKDVVIRHVCAMEALDFDDRPVIKVLMAATAPEEAGDCAAVERQLRRESRNPDGPVAGISAVLARGTAGELEWTDGMLFLPGRPSPYVSSWWSGVGEEKGPSNHFTVAKDAKPGVLAGRLWTARTKPMVAGTMVNTPDWKLDASFAVPVQKAAPVTEIIGAAAESHPATLAARKYLAAMQSGDRNAIRELQAPGDRAEFERLISERWEELKPELRSQAERASALPRVTVKLRGTFATVELGKAGARPTQFAMVLKQENGAWWDTNEQL